MKLINIDTGNIASFDDSDFEDSDEYVEDQMVEKVFGDGVKLFVENNRNSFPILGYAFVSDPVCRCTKKVAKVAIYV